MLKDWTESVKNFNSYHMKQKIIYTLKTTIRYLGIALVYVWDKLILTIEHLNRTSSHKHDFKTRLSSIRSIAKPYNNGLLISRNRKLTRKKSQEHILCCAPTGSGKTQRILLPALIEQLKQEESNVIFINDSAGEIYDSTSHFAKEQEYRIVVVNFSDASRSMGYNPLTHLRKENAQDIAKLSKVLVSSSLGESKDKFWELRAQSMLSFFIRLTLAQPDSRYHTMANVVHLFRHMNSGDPVLIDTTVITTNDDSLFEEWTGIVNTPEKMRASITETVGASLQIFDNQDVQAVTSQNDIDFHTLRQEGKVIVYLVNSVTDQRFFAPLVSIFWEQCYGSYLKSVPKDDEHPITVFMEEASSSHVPVLPIALKNARKSNISIVVFTQDFASLEELYGKEHRSIIANCGTHIYLAGGNHPISLLRELETLSGRMTYEDDKGRKQTRPVLTIEEIRSLPVGQSIIVHGNQPLIIGKHVAAFKHPRYRKVLMRSPLEFESTLANKDLPLIGKAIPNHVSDEDSE